MFSFYVTDMEYLFRYVYAVLHKFCDNSDYNEIYILSHSSYCVLHRYIKTSFVKVHHTLCCGKCSYYIQFAVGGVLVTYSMYLWAAQRKLSFWVLFPILIQVAYHSCKKRVKFWFAAPTSLLAVCLCRSMCKQRL